MRTRLAIPLVLAGFGCGGAKDGSGGPVGDAPSSPSPSAGTCTPAAAHDVVVASDDLNGYPPYAIAECQLVYVNRAGSLVLRDLGSTAEIVLAPADEKPRRPSVSIDERRLVVAWEARLSSGPAIRVRSEDQVLTVEGDFAMATEPRVRERFVAFTAWKGTSEADDADVWLFDVREKKARMVLGGPAQQRFADVSATHVAATDFSEDPDGRFDGRNDLADIVLFEIATGTVTRRSAPGKQAFPMLSNNGVLAYLAWGMVRPEPKLTAYDLRTGMIAADPTADKTIAHVEYAAEEPVRPTLAGDVLEWIANPVGAQPSAEVPTSLYRAPVDGSVAPARVAGLDDLVLYAPAKASATRSDFTVLAASARHGADRAPRLRAVARVNP